VDAIAGNEIFLFERFRLDRRAGGLFRCDEHGVLAPVAIGSRALDVLYILVRRHGELVPKDEIMAAVWPGTVVADSNLPIQILALRVFSTTAELEAASKRSPGAVTASSYR